MYDDRSSGLTALLLAVLVLAAPDAAAAPAAATASIARDQIFFVSRDPHPVMVAIILQRIRPASPEKPSVEAKVFISWRDRWHPPFYERVEIDRWRGDDLESAIAAWKEARADRSLRLDLGLAESSLTLSVRAPGSGFELASNALAPVAGEGKDPHGPVAWRSGPARLVLNGEESRGVVLAERLVDPRTAWPRFGRFEMWLHAPRRGGLVLGRRAFTERGPGEAVAVSPDGSGRRAPFEVTIDRTVTDAETGFRLPRAWRLGAGAVLEHVGGETTRGKAPHGGPAVYDVAIAREISGKSSALVFHLEDGTLRRARP